MLFRPIIVFLVCLLGLAGNAVAHSKMAKSSPAQGSTVKAGLSEIQLGFSKPVRVMLVKVKNIDGKFDVKADYKPAKTFKASFPVKVMPLATGAHEVQWTAVAKDGHVMKGTLSFKVAE